MNASLFIHPLTPLSRTHPLTHPSNTIITITISPGIFNLRDEIAKACEKATAMGFADGKKDLLTVTAGLPFGLSGVTNVIRVISSAGPVQPPLTHHSPSLTHIHQPPPTPTHPPPAPPHPPTPF